MMQAANLYLTFDGVLGSLGHSQVVRVVEGLARRGLPYLLVSLERGDQLARTERVQALRDRLGRVGVAWFPIPYDQAGTPRAAASNLARAAWKVASLCHSGRASRIHARGYHSALVAYSVHKATRVPFLFDARGYWIDERAAEGRWFGRPAVYNVAKRLERQLFSAAQAVITLTELQQGDLQNGQLGVRCSRVVTIPTCADFDSFRLRDGAGGSAVAAAQRERLNGQRVLALVGSLNASYHVEETYRLCRHAIDLASDVHVLMVSEQQAECRALLLRHGIPADRCTVVQAPHEEMPSWLGLIDCATLLLRENFAKRASMPTKLAEFFATGVRPLHYGCNPEVSDWVRRVGTGMVLSSLDDAELARAARFAATAPRDSELLSVGRERAAAHFSLRAGLDRYEALLRSLD